MEDVKLNERESLDLITRMISNSKKRLEIGSGNTFLVWGYITAIVAFAVSGMVYFTGNYVWCWGWFLIPLFGWPFMYVQAKKTKMQTVTYTDKVIDNIWSLLGIMFFICMVILVLLNQMNVMLPLSLILCGIGTSLTGIVIKFKWLIYAPVISFAVGTYLLGAMITNPKIINVSVFVLFGLCFVVMMIIPGHILNYKAKKENV